MRAFRAGDDIVSVVIRQNDASGFGQEVTITNLASQKEKFEKLVESHVTLFFDSGTATQPPPHNVR
jgi:hypothetical protein